MIGLLTTGGGATAGLRSGNGAVVGPVGVLEVIGGRSTRLGWSDSGRLFAPGTAGGLAFAMTGAFCGREELTERFVAVGGFAVTGWVLIGMLPDAGAGDEAPGDGELMGEEFGVG